MTATFVSRRSVLAVLTVCLTLCLALTGSAQQPPSDAIVGTWAADDGSVKLDMYKTERSSRLVFSTATRRSSPTT
jgi:hypothetical protein